MAYMKYGFEHFYKIMAHFGYTDEDKFLKKYREDPDFNKMVDFLENYHSRKKDMRELRQEVRKLKKNAGCRKCCCCGCRNKGVPEHA